MFGYEASDQLSPRVYRTQTDAAGGFVDRRPTRTQETCNKAEPLNDVPCALFE